jgi:hypothetical protein
MKYLFLSTSFFIFCISVFSQSPQITLVKRTIYPTVIALRFTCYWQGTTDNNWEVPSNWQCYSVQKNQEL